MIFKLHIARKYTQLLKICFVIIYCISVSLFQSAQNASAQSETPQPQFRSVHIFEFFPQKNGDVDVKLKIQLKNPTPDTFIEEYSLTIPTAYMQGSSIDDVDAGDDEVKIQSREDQKRIIFTFEKPVIENAPDEHILSVSYTFHDLFSSNEYVSEMLLPLIISQNPQTSVQAIVHVPDFISRKASSIRPAATRIFKDRIEWDALQNDVIAIQFGDVALYEFTGVQRLENPDTIAKNMTLTLPPDTPFQKLFLTSLEPTPDYVMLDRDGNYLASYKVPAKSDVNTVIKGHIQTFLKARKETLNFQKKMLIEQKNYLFKNSKELLIGSFYEDEAFQNLNTPYDVYTFTTETFTEDFDYDPFANLKKINEPKKKYSVADLLEKPRFATLYDLNRIYLALSRAQGTYTRTVQGYAFSPDLTIRPIQHPDDLQHTWVEYYNTSQNAWIPIDPMWGYVSHVDYFNLLDTYHIALALQGTQINEPAPLGFPRSDGNFLTMAFAKSNVKPIEKLQITTEQNNSQKANSPTLIEMTLLNSGNVFLYNSSIVLQAEGCKVSPTSIETDVIAPFQVQKKIISAIPISNSEYSTCKISFRFNENEVHSKTILLIQSEAVALYAVIKVFAGILILTIFVIFYYIYIRRKKRS